MIHITDSDVSVENSVSLTGVPAARISGSRVHFTNKSGGVVSSPVVDDPNTRDSAILLEGMNSIVTNESGGVVGASHGLDLAIMGSDFAERIENHGIMHGDIELRGGADIYDGRLGSQSGTVFGGDGNDTLLGGAGNDRLEAGSGSDSVSGGGGDDLLIGGDGDDLLYGGRGADRIEGGAGIDTVDFQDIYAVYVDLLADPFGKNGFRNGARGDVLIGIENLAGTNLDDRLFGDNGQNRLVGRAGNDLIVARGGSDDLFGGAGDDILHGGLGADLIDGGDGIDVRPIFGFPGRVGRSSRWLWPMELRGRRFACRNRESLGLRWSGRAIRRPWQQPHRRRTFRRAQRGPPGWPRRHRSSAWPRRKRSP